MTGYTFKEMMDNGFYDWTVISTEVVEDATDYLGCDYYEDCPCCNCGESIVILQTLARPRWSKSGKRMVEETETVWRCSSHVF